MDETENKRAETVYRLKGYCRFTDAICEEGDCRTCMVPIGETLADILKLGMPVRSAKNYHDESVPLVVVVRQ